MSRLPEYMGPLAVGLKMGVILPGMSIVEKVFEQLSRCNQDGFLHDGDIVCITESVVARAQNNYITTAHISLEIQSKLGLLADSKIAVIFPIASRNRFSMVLQGIAGAVPGGEVIIQLSYPWDEVGNQIACPEYTSSLGKKLITLDDITGCDCKHPITGVDYIRLYHDIIKESGAKPTVILCNDPLRALDYRPDGVLVADIHTRHATRKAIEACHTNCITLDQICVEGEASSEWGLLGSNMSAAGKIKLAPRGCEKIVRELQRLVQDRLGVAIEVIIYGDGAYKDPTSGIYELADPCPAFAATDGLDCYREGIKYKYLADHYFYEHGKNATEIEEILVNKLREKLSDDLPGDSIEKEGTTPRKLQDVLASLADLVSGSADAGTPVVLIKGF